MAALLEAARRVDTVDGQCALALAESIDAGNCAASGLGTAIKALRETVAIAVAGSAPDRPLDAGADELLMRRDLRRRQVEENGA